MISQEQAIEIAKQYCGGEFKLFSIKHGVIGYPGVYRLGMWAPDDVWCISCSYHPGKTTGLFSSRVIVIHKDTGKILYDGSACDEG